MNLSRQHKGRGSRIEWEHEGAVRLEAGRLNVYDEDLLQEARLRILQELPRKLAARWAKSTVVRYAARHGMIDALRLDARRRQAGRNGARRVEHVSLDDGAHAEALALPAPQPDEPNGERLELAREVLELLPLQKRSIVLAVLQYGTAKAAAAAVGVSRIRVQQVLAEVREKAERMARERGLLPARRARRGPAALQPGPCGAQDRNVAAGPSTLHRSACA